MSCRACIAAFWRSAKFGSLNPLIKEALSLSLSGLDAPNARNGA
jgi:hypothetical protein